MGVDHKIAIQIMTNETKSPPKPQSAHTMNRKELRASFLLPTLIILGIWLAGLLVFAVAPDEFDTAVGLVVTTALFLYLIFWTKDAEPRTRVFALLMAIPALIGIAFGIIYGRATAMIIGISMTIILLVIYRALNTPLSYRFAYRALQQGDNAQALELLNKAIEARPKFWESYQLEAMIYLTEMQFEQAENSAKQGLIFKPDAHILFNTLGQIYLAQNRFQDSQNAYASALELDVDNGMYWYYLGLNQYRLRAYRDAAESFTAAIKNTLRYLEFELMAHYYLWRSLQQLELADEAATVHEKMQKFVDGVPLVQQETEQLPSYAHKPLLAADVADLVAQFDEGTHDKRE